MTNNPEWSERLSIPNYQDWLIRYIVSIRKQIVELDVPYDTFFPSGIVSACISGLLVVVSNQPSHWQLPSIYLPLPEHRLSFVAGFISASLSFELANYQGKLNARIYSQYMQTNHGTGRTVWYFFPFWNCRCLYLWFQLLVQLASGCE